MTHVQAPLNIQECPGGFYIKSGGNPLGIVYDINNANLFAAAPNIAEAAENLLKQIQGIKAATAAGISVPIEDLCQQPIAELKYTLNLLNRKPNQVVKS